MHPTTPLTLLFLSTSVSSWRIGLWGNNVQRQLSGTDFISCARIPNPIDIGQVTFDRTNNKGLPVPNRVAIFQGANCNVQLYTGTHKLTGTPAQRNGRAESYHVGSEQ